MENKVMSEIMRLDPEHWDDKSIYFESVTHAYGLLIVVDQDDT